MVDTSYISNQLQGVDGPVVIRARIFWTTSSRRGRLSGDKRLVSSRSVGMSPSVTVGSAIYQDWQRVTQVIDRPPLTDAEKSRERKSGGAIRVMREVICDDSGCHCEGFGEGTEETIAISSEYLFPLRDRLIALVARWRRGDFDDELACVRRSIRTHLEYIGNERLGALRPGFVSNGRFARQAVSKSDPVYQFIGVVPYLFDELIVQSIPEIELEELAAFLTRQRALLDDIEQVFSSGKEVNGSLDR